MIAPADQALHRRWPLWRKALVYATLFAVASASVWLVDRFAMRPAVVPVTVGG